MNQPPLSEDELAKLKRILANFVELSPDEIKAMRELVEHDKRAKWLWASVRNFSVWLVAVIGGISLAYESLITAVKHLAGR